MTLIAKAAYKYYNTLASNASGKPLIGYYVKFFLADDDSVATRYTDETALNEQTAPVVTDANGYFDTFVKPDYYNIRFYATEADYVANANVVLLLEDILHDGFTNQAAEFTSYDPTGTIISTNVQDAVAEALDDANSNISNISARVTTLEANLADLEDKFQSIRTEYVFTASSNNQSVFTIPTAYDPNVDNVDVFINGVKQPANAFTLTNTTTVTLENGVGIGTEVIVIIATVSNAVKYYAYYSQTITATDGQTVFTIAAKYTPGGNTLAVYMNGLRLLPTDYTETDTHTVTLTTGATVGDELQFVTATEVNSTSISVEYDNVINKPYTDIKDSAEFSYMVTIANSNPTINYTVNIIDNINILGDITVPSNLEIVMRNIGMFTVASGKTLTIAAPFSCGLFQCFSGAGSAVFSAGSVSEVYPEWWGAVGDGATNDTASLASAFTAFTDVYLTQIYKTTTGVSAGSAINIRGTGTLKTSSNVNILAISTNNVTIQGVKFLGDGKGATADSATNNLQTGVYVYGKYYVRILGCRFESLGGSGVHVEQAITPHSVATISDSTFYANNNGINCAERGEYVSAIGCTFLGNNRGLYITGGNFLGVGIKVNNNTDGVVLNSGSNDSHGVISASQINHNVDYNIRSEAIANGFIFDSCELYEASIWLKGKGVVIKNSILDADAYYFQGSTGTVIQNNIMPHGYTNTIHNNYSTSPSQTTWKDNKDLDGKLYPANGQGSLWGGSVRADFSAGDVSIAGDNAYHVLKPSKAGASGYQMHSNDTAYTLESFYDDATGIFTVGGYTQGQVYIRTCVILTITGATPSNVFVVVKIGGTIIDTLIPTLAGGLYYVQGNTPAPAAVAGSQITVSVYVPNSYTVVVKDYAAATYITATGL